MVNLQAESMKKKITFIMNPVSGTVSKARLPELIEPSTKTSFSMTLSLPSVQDMPQKLQKML